MVTPLGVAATIYDNHGHLRTRLVGRRGREGPAEGFDKIDIVHVPSLIQQHLQKILPYLPPLNPSPLF